MIKLIRIDDRLVHGQVALVWTPALSADCLIVANDKVAKDDFLKMTLGFAKPANAKLLIFSVAEAIDFLNDAKNEGLKCLVLINSVEDAYLLAESVREIKSINFGGLRTREGAKLISKAVALTDSDISLANGLIEKGVELEIRQVPTENKQLLQNLL